MTSVSNISSGIPMYEDANPLKAVGKQELDRQDFMTLFITQMQHQDPLSPMESYEMASQLAQFSTMEANLKVADKMGELLDYQKSQNNLQLLSLINKDVQTFGNEVGVAGGESSPINFVMTEAAASATLYIYAPNGSLIKTMDLGYQNAGEQQVSWDGTNNNGDTVADGLYSYSIDALSAEGRPIETEYRSTGRVTGLEFNSGKATLTVDGYLKRSVGDVLSVH